MSGIRRRASVLLVGGVVLLGGVGCASDSTTTSDTAAVSSTASGTAPSTTEAPGEAPGTTVAEAPGSTAGPATTAVDDGPVTTAGDDGPDPSVPIVDPASVEAFCALDEQLDGLAETQMANVDISDPEAFRLVFVAFLTDNAAVIDQYLAAAPPEIEDDARAAVDETRAAAADPATFQEMLSGESASSERVSDFIDANCP